MIGLRGPGDHFGEMALVAENRPRAATLVALEDSETFAVSKTEFDRLRARVPGRQRCAAAPARRPRCGSSTSAFSRRCTFPRRSASAASLRARRVLPREAGAIDVPLTQEQLAELAGTSRATVNRVLRDEEGRGTLELGRGKTIVLDAQPSRSEPVKPRRRRSPPRRRADRARRSRRRARRSCRARRRAGRTSPSGRRARRDTRRRTSSAGRTSRAVPSVCCGRDAARVTTVASSSTSAGSIVAPRRTSRRDLRGQRRLRRRRRRGRRREAAAGRRRSGTRPGSCAARSGRR